MSELRQLQDITITDLDISRLIESLSDIDEAEKAKYVHTFGLAMRTVFLQVTILMAVGTMASCLIRNHELGNTIRSDHKLRPTTAETDMEMLAAGGGKMNQSGSLSSSSAEVPVFSATQPVLRTD